MGSGAVSCNACSHGLTFGSVNRYVVRRHDVDGVLCNVWRHQACNASASIARDSTETSAVGNAFMEVVSGVLIWY